MLGCGPIGLLILQVLKAAGAGEVLAVRSAGAPARHGRAAGRDRAGASVADIAAWTEGEGAPLVIEATNDPLGFRDAVLAARIGGRVVLVGIPDGDTYTLPAADARRRGLKIKFSRRMGRCLSARHRARRRRQGRRGSDGDQPVRSRRCAGRVPASRRARTGRRQEPDRALK